MNFKKYISSLLSILLLSSLGFSETLIPTYKHTESADEIILNIQDNQSLAEYQNSAFLYNSWEVFYQTLNVVDGLVNAPGAIKSLANLSNPDGSFTFISPGGVPVTLKGNITQLEFSTFKDAWFDYGLNKKVEGSQLAGQPTGFFKKNCTKIRTPLKKSFFLVLLFAWQNVTASDINISLIVPCESVDAFVYCCDESQLFTKLAVCPPRPNTDCSSLQHFEFQNIGSCAFRINRAAKARLTNLSTV